MVWRLVGWSWWSVKSVSVLLFVFFFCVFLVLCCLSRRCRDGCDSFYLLLILFIDCEQIPFAALL